MLVWVAILLGTVVACEVGLRLPLPRLLSGLKRSVHQVRSILPSQRISDHWKEKMLPAYAGRILVASLSLFGYLLLIALPVVIAVSAAAGSPGAGSAILMRPLVLLVMIVVGIGYVMGRQKLTR